MERGGSPVTPGLPPLGTGFVLNLGQAGWIPAWLLLTNAFWGNRAHRSGAPRFKGARRRGGRPPPMPKDADM